MVPSYLIYLWDFFLKYNYTMKGAAKQRFFFSFWAQKHLRLDLKLHKLQLHFGKYASPLPPKPIFPFLVQNCTVHLVDCLIYIIM